MDVLNITQKQKTKKENAFIILENPSSMISKKDGHAAIKLSTIGINFKNYRLVQSENTHKINNKVHNFSNQTQFKMQPTL
jgi:hypothetical protein